jgi:hypothetical protein
MENVCILYGHLEFLRCYGMYILGPSGNFEVICNIFPHFGILLQQKFGNSGLSRFPLLC